jgi:hypothetical protein
LYMNYYSAANGPNNGYQFTYQALNITAANLTILDALGSGASTLAGDAEMFSATAVGKALGPLALGLGIVSDLGGIGYGYLSGNAEQLNETDILQMATRSS